MSIIQPSVTIAVPVYNVEKYVERALNSILIQDYPNINILVVYDISDDNSIFVVKKTLEKSPYKYRIIEKDSSSKGLGKSRNIILENFDGDYLYFLDSDDYIEPNTISLMIRHAINNKADLVAGSHQSIDDNGNTIQKYQYKSFSIFDNISFRRSIYVKNNYYSIYTWNKLYERTFIKKNNLYFLHDIVEDAIFSFNVIKKAQKVILLPNITLNYLIRSESITNSILYNDITVETAKIYLSIRDYIYLNNTDKLIEDFCSSIDAFLFGYIMTVRNTYASNKINYHDKLELCRIAFGTPKIPAKYLIYALKSKKKTLILLLLVKSLSFRLNILLVKIYQKIK